MSLKKITRYRNVEYLQYISYVIDTLKKEDLEALGISQLLLNLEAEYNSLVSYHKVKVSSDLTPIIEDLEKQRNKALVGLKTFVNAYMYSFDEALENAALALQEAINTQNVNTNKLNYQTKTFYIVSLLNEFNSDDDLVSAINALGLNGMVEKLTTFNAAFREAYLERVDQSVESPYLGIRDLRGACDAAYDDLVFFLGAESRLRKEPVYNDLLSKIDKLIEKYDVLHTSNNDDDVITDEELRNTFMKKN